MMIYKEFRAWTLAQFSDIDVPLLVSAWDVYVGEGLLAANHYIEEALR